MRKQHSLAKIVSAVLDHLMVTAFMMIAFWPEIAVLLGITVLTTIGTILGMAR